MKRLLAALLLLPAAGCLGPYTHKLSDPTLVLQTRGGTELGVSTEYGVVFLGRTARSGPVEIMAWFGDGPNIESTVIEPVAAELCTAETEIRLPSVPLTFVEPRAGDTVMLVGRKDLDRWEHHVNVRSDPSVEGILLDVPAQFRAGNDQVGAGVFVCPEGDCKRKMLVGLVAGRISLEGEGGSRTYLTVVGPRELWRLATHRKDLLRRKPWVYRDDIL